MKKLIVIIFFAFIKISLLQSQSSLELGFTTGTELSIPSSSNPANVSDYRIMPGFNLAFRIQHNFERRYSLVGGIEYGRMYWLRNSDPTAIPEIYVDHWIHIANQIRIPLLFQVNFGKSKSQFYLNTGMCFLGTFSDANSGSGYLPESQTWISGSPNVVLPWNIGGILTAGYSYKIKETMRFIAESKFQVPIIANPAYSTNYNTTRNLVIGLSVGLSFTTSPKK